MSPINTFFTSTREKWFFFFWIPPFRRDKFTRGILARVQRLVTSICHRLKWRNEYLIRYLSTLPYGNDTVVKGALLTDDNDTWLSWRIESRIYIFKSRSHISDKMLFQSLRFSLFFFLLSILLKPSHMRFIKNTTINISEYINMKEIWNIHLYTLIILFFIFDIWMYLLIFIFIIFILYFGYFMRIISINFAVPRS